MTEFIVYIADSQRNGIWNRFSFKDGGWAMSGHRLWDEEEPGRLWGLWGQSAVPGARGVASLRKQPGKLTRNSSHHFVGTPLV